MKKKIQPILFIILGIGSIYFLFNYLNGGADSKNPENSKQQKLMLDIPNPNSEKIEENKLKLYQASFDDALKYTNDDEISLKNEKNTTIDSVQFIKKDTTTMITRKDTTTTIARKDTTTMIGKDIQKPQATRKRPISSQLTVQKKTPLPQNKENKSSPIPEKKKEEVQVKKTFTSKSFQKNREKNGNYTIDVCEVSVFKTQYLDKIGQQVAIILTKDAMMGNDKWKKGTILYADTYSGKRGIEFRLSSKMACQGKQKNTMLVGYGENDKKVFNINKEDEEEKHLKTQVESSTNELNRNSLLPWNLRNTFRFKKNKVNKIIIPNGFKLYFKCK